MKYFYVARIVRVAAKKQLVSHRKVSNLEAENGEKNWIFGDSELGNHLSLGSMELHGKIWDIYVYMGNIVCFPGSSCWIFTLICVKLESWNTP